MIASPTAAIDLPLKGLAWQDSGGTVWLSYNNPVYLGKRHEIPFELLKHIEGISRICEEAVRHQAKQMNAIKAKRKTIKKEKRR